MYLVDEPLFNKDDVTVVIPAFNEELTIGSVVLKTKKYAGHVIVVDDGSSDRTTEVASMAGAKVLRLDRNQGKANAVKKGFAEARGRDSLVVVMLDGDGQHDPEDIGGVIAPILDGRADLVIGSRQLNGGNKIPRYRRLGQIVLDRFTNVGAGLNITDSQSGFRALSMKAVNNMDFPSNGYGIESDMLIHFAEMGLVIREVPIGVRYDVPHKHKKNPVTMGVNLVNRLLTVVSLKRPLLLIGVPGLVLGILGLGLGLASIQGWYILGWSWMFESVLSGFLISLGSVLVITGLFLKAIVKGQFMRAPSIAAPIIEQDILEKKIVGK